MDVRRPEPTENRENLGMTVRRIVANIAANDTAPAKAFYGAIFGLDVLMDMGWIVTFGSEDRMTVQMSVMTEGGSGTPVPDISIEVDDLDDVLTRLEQAGHRPVYGPTEEPWGVRRFYIRDPYGRLINVLTHIETETLSAGRRG